MVDNTWTWAAELHYWVECPYQFCRAEKSSHRYLIESLHASSIMHSAAKTYFTSELKGWCLSASVREMDSKKVSLFLIVSLLFMATISPCAFSMREIPLTFDGVDEITTSNTKNIPLSNVMMPKSADSCLPPGTSPCLIGDVGCCSGICLRIFPGICAWIFVSVKTTPWSSGIEEAINEDGGTWRLEKDWEIKH